MNPERTNVGRAPLDICEDEAGSVLAKAILLTELDGALESVVAEWEYDDGPLAKEFVALCREFAEVVQRTHLADDGTLVDAGESDTDGPTPAYYEGSARGDLAWRIAQAIKTGERQLSAGRLETKEIRNCVLVALTDAGVAFEDDGARYRLVTPWVHRPVKEDVDV